MCDVTSTPGVRLHRSVVSDWGLASPDPDLGCDHRIGRVWRLRAPALISDPRLAVDVYFSRVPDDYRADTRQSPGPKLTDRVMGNLCINSSSNHGPWSQADLIQTSGAISDIAEIIRQLVILLSSSSSQPAEHPASWMQGRGNTCAYKKAKNIGPNRNRIAKIPHSHFRFSDRLCFNI